MKVLVVDNNTVILGFLSDILNREGFTVVTANSGQSAIEQYKKTNPDFICLDIMMPDISGYDVCKEIRKENEEIPIIFITSKNETAAVARRSIKSKSTQDNNDFTIADLQIEPDKLSASRDANTIDLNLRDIKILKLLHEKKNTVVHRDTLIDYCWGAHIMPESRTVDWHVSQLRKKIEIDPKSPRIIKTVHGVGYRYEE